MTSKDMKNNLLASMRERLPLTLPARLSDVMPEILDHAQLSVEMFGSEAKYKSVMAQCVKALKDEGLMRREGWVWSWVSPTEDVKVQPTSDVSVALSLFDDEGFEEVIKPPSLYDLSDNATLIRLVASTSCFGKVVESDLECVGCPLLTHCLEKKGEDQRLKKQAKLARDEALAQAQELGYNISNVKVPKKALITEGREIVCLKETTCCVTNDTISEGELATHIPSWGLMKKIIADLIQDI